MTPRLAIQDVGGYQPRSSVKHYPGCKFKELRDPLIGVAAANGP